MLKKIVLLGLILLTISSYKFYKSHQIPFNKTPCQGNWVKYSNHEVQFEYPHDLSILKKNKMANLPNVSDSQNELFYVFKGLSSGIPSINEIVKSEKLFSIPKEIMDSLKKIIPGQSEDFYVSISKDPSRFELIKTIPLDPLNFKYAHEIRVGVDTFLYPIEISLPILEQLKTYTFFIDTIDNCYRKIYYNSINPSKYAVCFLSDLDSQSNKHAIISLTEVDSLATNYNLNKEDILRFLKSFRITKR